MLIQDFLKNVVVAIVGLLLLISMCYHEANAHDGEHRWYVGYFVSSDYSFDTTGIVMPMLYQYWTRHRESCVKIQDGVVREGFADQGTSYCDRGNPAKPIHNVNHPYIRLVKYGDDVRVNYFDEDQQTECENTGRLEDKGFNVWCIHDATPDHPNRIIRIPRQRRILE